MTLTEMQQLPFDIEITPFVALEHLVHCAQVHDLCPHEEGYPRATSDAGLCYLRGGHDWVEGPGWCGPDSGGMEATCALCGCYTSHTLY